MSPDCAFLLFNPTNSALPGQRKAADALPTVVQTGWMERLLYRSVVDVVVTAPSHTHRLTLAASARGCKLTARIEPASTYLSGPWCAASANRPVPVRASKCSLREAVQWLLVAVFASRRGSYAVWTVKRRVNVARCWTATGFCVLCPIVQEL